MHLTEVLQISRAIFVVWQLEKYCEKKNICLEIASTCEQFCLGLAQTSRWMSKGQLILKQDCRAIPSHKRRTLDI